MGIDPVRHRLRLHLCGNVRRAGRILVAQALGFLSPEKFQPAESINVLTMTIVGGLGSIGGPIIGAVVFTTFAEVARATKGLREVVFSILLLVCLIFFLAACTAPSTAPGAGFAERSASRRATLRARRLAAQPWMREPRRPR
jgi:branched-chain amino acid transport system permease protein